LSTKEIVLQANTYIDGILLAVPTANQEAYRQHAKAVAQLLKEHSATQVVECWGDDVPQGKLTSMPMAVQCKNDETVVFSWIAWPSREARDRGMQAFMDDPRMPGNMPFDGRRVIFGGFRPLVTA